MTNKLPSLTSAAEILMIRPGDTRRISFLPAGRIKTRQRIYNALQRLQRQPNYKIHELTDAFILERIQ